jgi:hypothetical protein
MLSQFATLAKLPPQVVCRKMGSTKRSAKNMCVFNVFIALNAPRYLRSLQGCSVKVVNHTTNIPKVDALYECCNAFYTENGDNASSVCCPKVDLLRYVFALRPGMSAKIYRLKMKQRAQGS